MPAVARLRAARKDAGNTPAMIVRMRAGNMPAALARRPPEPGRDDRQQDRRGEYNYNSRDSRSQGRPEYARDDRRDGRFDGRREQGHAGRGDERHGQRAYQDGPSGQNRQGPRFDGGRDDRDFRGERDGRPGAERRDGRPGQDSRPTSGHGGPRGGQARASQPSRPRQPYAAIRIDQVQRVLGEIPQWTYPADAALSHWLRGHPGSGRPRPFRSRRSCSTTCCGICGATASTVKAALARPRAVWPSWAWPPRWARRNWPKG